ncbi:hypothetical protein RRG08_046717 [Elysia crispata]|uniref:Peptidase S1 domain-containing protein n=1 Tax=Elysia crispata TaxID=231223 RepID=A0AAE0ZVB2_9GAST|nr:hypothetical protein RRG08_046717 [Elysia crispata]
MVFKRFSFVALFGGLMLVSSLSAETSHSRRERAIGGRLFSRGKWPSLVLLRAAVVTERNGLEFTTKQSYCGGVLINRHWILSAAHCYVNHRLNGLGEAQNWKARLGTVDYSTSEYHKLRNDMGCSVGDDEMREWEIDIKKIVLHPSFDNRNGPSLDDIALIKLSRPAPKISRIEPIALPSQTNTSFPSRGQMCTTMGWGCTSRGGGVSLRAVQIHLPIYSNRLCRKMYKVFSLDKNFCAGYRSRRINISTCRGDSGGPLLCTSGSQYTLAGILHGGRQTSRGSYPRIFQRVQHYLPWIQSVIS